MYKLVEIIPGKVGGTSGEVLEDNFKVPKGFSPVPQMGIKHKGTVYQLIGILQEGKTIQLQVMKLKDTRRMQQQGMQGMK